MPIVYEGDDLGTIECGPKIDGAFAPEDVRLVDTLAAQAALAIANGRLAGRIVHAQETERRRIERNIHDGAQQELVALIARLGMAQNQLDNGGLAPDTLQDLQGEARRILADLRELAQGIHPSVLTDGGLLEAVEEKCAGLPISVTLSASDGLRQKRFSDDVEGAAYFFVTEGLANVLKHAGASSAHVALSQSNGALHLEVADDGSGFEAAATTQNGLAGLRDRITALGGTVQIEGRNGRGTVLSATLPLEHQEA